jgi:glycosyltransferase involved in cell wall biosynthesis
MQHSLVVLVPGSLHQRTGGYEYDRRMVAGLQARGWLVQVYELDSSFPDPTNEARRGAADILATLPDGAAVLVDGLAFGAIPSEVLHESRRLNIVALVHMPLGAAPGLDRRSAAALAESERRALSAARLILVTGRTTVSVMAGYGVEGNRVAVVEPGTDRAPLARGSSNDRVALLSVGSVTIGKGHELLIRALASVRERGWTLTCAGSLERDPATVRRVRDVVEEEKLTGHVSLVGELDDTALRACYERSDAFVLATLFETYCMAVADALAHGLPVVSTCTGAIPDLVRLGDDSGEPPAGLLTPPGDGDALAAALSRFLGDASLRASLAAAARRVRTRLPSWDEAVDKMTAALEPIFQARDA